MIRDHENCNNNGVPTPASLVQDEIVSGDPGLIQSGKNTYFILHNFGDKVITSLLSYRLQHTTDHRLCGYSIAGCCYCCCCHCEDEAFRSVSAMQCYIGR